MNPKKELKLRLQLSNPTRNNYGCLENCLLENCKGDQQKKYDVEAFQAALGYTEEIRRAGLLFEEYIFEEYSKVNAPQNSDVLQEKIVNYLSERCIKFEEAYFALVGIQLAADG